MTADINALVDWRFSIDVEGIAWCVLDCQGKSVNTIGRRPLTELAALLDRLEPAAAAKEIRGAVLLSAKPSGFLHGADIEEFESFRSEAEVQEALARILPLLDRLERLPVPVVAAIHGYCLGGGLELAMACHWRIASREDSTRIGLPEIKLGIFPGFNGTARSIRLAGPVAAMDMMLRGSMLRASVARAIGLVDELVPTHHKLRWAARKAVLQGRRSNGASLSKRFLGWWPFRGMLASRMKAETAKKVREAHYPAPFRLIELFRRHGGSERAMKANEPKFFAPLMVSATSRNLRRVFALSERLKAQAPKDVGFTPRRVHVVGAGTMGADIAAWCVISGLEVSLQDQKPEALERARAQAEALFRKRLRTPTEIEAAKARFLLDPEGKGVPRADVVIEAIVERLEAKQGLFMALEPRLKPGAVLATNTSSLPIEDIARPLADPARLIGLHFFNPVPQLPLVEVVRGPDTRQSEVDKGCAVVTAISKYPLITKSTPGFLVNRVLAPYMLSAMERLEKGEGRDKIDAAAKSFGMPVGPLELADQVGLDICKHVAEILGLASSAAPGSSRFEKLVAAGKLGKKSGEGFYVWKDGEPVRTLPKEPWPEAELAPLGEALVKPLIDECERCVAERVVAGADMVDAGVIFGTGFAPFRGGPLHHREATRAITAAKA